MEHRNEKPQLAAGAMVATFATNQTAGGTKVIIQLPTQKVNAENRAVQDLIDQARERETRHARAAARHAALAAKHRAVRRELVRLSRSKAVRP